MQNSTAVALPKPGPTILYTHQDPDDKELEKQKHLDCGYRSHCLAVVSQDERAKGFTCVGCNLYSKKGSEDVMEKTAMLFKMPSVYALMDVPLANIIMDFEIQEKFFKSLFNSVKSLGLVLQPVILVENGDGKYRVYAGKRRILSAQKKGIEAISAMVFPKGTPEPLLRIYSIAENMNRSPNPADEADNLTAVMAFYGWNAEEAAKKLSLPVQHIRDRLKLKQLIPEFFAMLKEGKLKVTFARKICTLPNRIQKSLLKQDKLTLSDIQERSKDYKLNKLMASEELFEISAINQDPLDEIKADLASFIESQKSDTAILQNAVLFIEQYQRKRGGI